MGGSMGGQPALAERPDNLAGGLAPAVPAWGEPQSCVPWAVPTGHARIACSLITFGSMRLPLSIPSVPIASV
jgi:hypothetical protein